MPNDGSTADGPVARRSRPVVDIVETATVDAIFDALADERRRSVLGLVLGRSGATTLDELADHLLAAGHVTPGATDANERDRLRCRLYHADLPTLQEAGIVEFDRTRNEVRPTDDPRLLTFCQGLLRSAGL